jgi:hypothetical protein
MTTILIKTIPHLVKQLEKSTIFDQSSLVTSYIKSSPFDWKSFIRFQHGFYATHYPRDIELWRSSNSSLVLKGWNKENYENLYSFGMIQTFVLDGSIDIRNTTTKRHSILLLPNGIHNAPYHQMFHYATFQKTATLQLIQTCFNK